MRKYGSRLPKLPTTILVGVDERGLADHAVQMGCELGARLRARVDLVQVVPVPPQIWDGTDPVRGAALSAEMLTATSQAVHARVRGLLRAGLGEEEEGGGAAVATGPERNLVRVVPGQPAKVLLEEVRRTRAGLLMIGPHGKRGFLDFGNTMRAVFAKATVPVWVQSHPVEPIREILAAVDLSRESLSALSMARSLAGVLGAKVRALQCFDVEPLSMTQDFEQGGYVSAFPLAEVREKDRARFEDAMAGFDWRGVPHRVDFLDGDPVRTILEVASDCDLVVLGAHGRTGLASVLLGGVAYGVLKRSPKPTLVMRSPGRTFLM